MIYITNAFSIQMLDRSATDDLGRSLEFVPASAGAVLDDIHVNGLEWVGAIGHADTAAVVAADLGVPVDRLHARVSVTLRDGDSMWVAQYRGPRLPEGATSLPDGATIEWWLVH